MRCKNCQAKLRHNKTARRHYWYLVDADSHGNYVICRNNSPNDHEPNMWEGFYEMQKLSR